MAGEKGQKRPNVEQGTVADGRTVRKFNGRLDDKAADIDRQIEAVQRNERIVRKVGSTVAHSLEEELVFQRKRRAVLAWASTATPAQIQARIDALEAELGEAAGAKYGLMRGLPQAQVEAIAEVELLELATRQHPAQTPMRTLTFHANGTVDVEEA